MPHCFRHVTSTKGQWTYKKKWSLPLDCHRNDCFLRHFKAFLGPKFGFCDAWHGILFPVEMLKTWTIIKRIRSCTQAQQLTSFGRRSCIWFGILHERWSNQCFEKRLRQKVYLRWWPASCCSNTPDPTAIRSYNTNEILLSHHKGIHWFRVWCPPLLRTQFQDYPWPYFTSAALTLSALVLAVLTMINGESPIT